MLFEIKIGWAMIDSCRQAEMVLTHSLPAGSIVCRAIIMPKELSQSGQRAANGAQGAFSRRKDVDDSEVIFCDHLLAVSSFKSSQYLATVHWKRMYKLT